MSAPYKGRGDRPRHHPITRFLVGKDIEGGIYERATGRGTEPYIELRHRSPGDGGRQSFACSLRRFEEIYAKAKAIVEERRQGREQGPRQAQGRGRPDKFSLGRIVIRPDVAARVNPADIARALDRHASGHWGSVDAETRQANDQAVDQGGEWSIYSHHSTLGPGSEAGIEVTTYAHLRDRRVTVVSLAPDPNLSAFDLEQDGLAEGQQAQGEQRSPDVERPASEHHQAEQRLRKGLGL
jgi:hypothetical protein